MVVRSWPQRLHAVAAISLLIGGSAMAQTVNDAKAQAAHAEWRKLSQNEINCIDKSLRAQRSGVWDLIRRGINPSDVAVGTIRAACRTQARVQSASTTTRVGSQAAAAMAAADKVAPDTPTDKAAAEKASADKAARDRAAADKAAADKAAADKTAADKAAADKAGADKAAPARAAADKVTTDNAAVDLARADAQRAMAEAIAARADADRARKEAEKTIADVGFALAAAESKIGFIYGLMGSLVLLGLGAIVFLVMHNKRNAANPQSEAATPENDAREKQSEFDRLVAAVLDEQKRRERKVPPKPVASVRKQPVEEPALP
jgi:hypothetical protein